MSTEARSKPCAQQCYPQMKQAKGSFSLFICSLYPHNPTLAHLDLPPKSTSSDSDPRPTTGYDLDPSTWSFWAFISRINLLCRGVLSTEMTEPDLGPPGSPQPPRPEPGPLGQLFQQPLSGVSGLSPTSECAQSRIRAHREMPVS